MMEENRGNKLTLQPVRCSILLLSVTYNSCFHLIAFLRRQRFDLLALPNRRAGGSLPILLSFFFFFQALNRK